MRNLIFFIEAPDACAAENALLEYCDANLHGDPLTERSLSIEAIKPAEYYYAVQHGNTILK